MEFDVEVWFDGFWTMYEAKLCGGGPQKGAKSKAIESARKRVKTKEKGKEILLALAAQKKFYYDCLKNNTFHANFPMAVTWLNQERWTIDIDSHSEMREKATSKPCRCGKPIIVNYDSGGLCLDCHNKHYEPHDWRYHMCREKYKEMVLDQEDSKTSWELSKRMTKAFLAKHR